MPMTEDGEHAEIILNSLSIVGRLNPSVLYEQELNFIASQIVKKYKSNKKNLLANILKFYEITNHKQYEFIKEVLDSYTKDEVNSYLSEIIESGDMYIHQPPFYGNIKFKELCELYEVFGIEKVKFKDINTPLVFGKLFFIKLKFSFAMWQHIVVISLIAGNSLEH